MDNNEITLSLTSEEAQFILSVLGELPSKTGAFVLMQKVGAQIKSAKESAQT